MADLHPDRAYAKSAKGRDELAQRGTALTRSQRSVLIVIDGKTPLRKLLDRFAAVTAFRDDVATLLDQGYIVAVPAAVRSGDRPAGTATGRRDRLIELAQRLLGEHAGRVVGRLEKCSDAPGELLAAVEACAKLIRLTIDEHKADRFRTDALGIVDGG